MDIFREIPSGELILLPRAKKNYTTLIVDFILFLRLRELLENVLLINLAKLSIWELIAPV
jgi:hypothetical protein